MIRFNVPYISGLETQYMSQAIEQKSIAGGGKFGLACEDYFEKNFGFQKCYMTPSCTAAIEMAALILNLKEEDEIIVPSFTFASCPNPFMMGGAKVVLADCDERHPNITVDQIKHLVNDNTKAVMVMHYGGCGLAVEAVAEFCKSNNLYLIEDAAQCVNAFHNQKALGSFGDLSVFSFHETKNINSGEGGMLVINNPSLIEKAEIVRQYGTNRTAFQQGKASHYEWKGNGLALFMSELNAAFLWGQLEKLSEVSQYRIELWNSYYNQLSNFTSSSTFELPKKELFTQANAHTFYMHVKNNKLDEFIEYMDSKNIQVVKHFYPLHLTTIKNHAPQTEYSCSSALQNELVRLPLHANLSSENVDQICEEITSFFGQ